jgi:hypothetical protein
MASSSKKKTTMAKLMRESKLRERRLDKQARKDARKRLSADGAGGLGESPSLTGDEPSQAGEPPRAAEPPQAGEPQPAETGAAEALVDA